MNTYEQVTYSNNGLQRVILRNAVEIDFLGGRAITGIRVNKEGTPVGAKGVDEIQELIGSDLVVARIPLRMSLHYGELQPESFFEEGGR